ncbi:hypothetical protein [Pseudomonas fluorescens]|nr:hypothetical protein [Pseudomonas fluorescens]
MIESPPPSSDTPVVVPHLSRSSADNLASTSQNPTPEAEHPQVTGIRQLH